MADQTLASFAARGGRPARGEPLLDRAFRILTAFGPDHRSLSLTALSLRAGLPKASALRIVRKLVEWDALERTGDGEYVVGARLLDVASLAPHGRGLRAAARPYLADLHYSTGQDALLAVRDGLEAVVVERLSADPFDEVGFRVGSRAPLHATGVGLVLLAYAPSHVQDELLASDLVQQPENERRSREDLRGRLAEIRRAGVAIAIRQPPKPRTSVAVPITDQRDRVIAAVSIVAGLGHADPATLRPAAVAIGRAISRAAAGRPASSDAAEPAPPRAEV